MSFTRLLAGGRRIRLAAAATLLALAAAGCSSFVTAPTAVQDNVIGNVSVSSEICVDGFAQNDSPPGYFAGACESNPPAGLATEPEGTYTAGGEGEMLIGYLVPDGTTSPQTLTSPDLPGVTFTPSSDYATWLTANETAPSGYEWSAYMSSDFTVSEATDVHLTAQFTPPAGSEGTPFTVEQIEIGDRADGSIDGATEDTDGNALTPTRPLDCGEDVTDGTDDYGVTGCTDDQSLSSEDADLTVDLNSLLSVTPPSSPISAQAGSTIIVPFTVQYTGSAGPSASFATSATSNAPGVTPAPADATIVPTGDEGLTEDVSVPLPAGLAPGAYTVALSLQAPSSACTDPSQCAEAATASIDVSAAPAATTPTTTTTPTPTPVTPTMTAVKLNGRTLVVNLKLNVAAVEHLTLQRRVHRKWHKVKAITHSLGAGQRTLSLRKLFDRQLKHAGHYRVMIVATSGDAKSGQRTVSFTVR